MHKIWPHPWIHQFVSRSLQLHRGQSLIILLLRHTCFHHLDYNLCKKNLIYAQSYFLMSKNRRTEINGNNKKIIRNAIFVTCFDRWGEQTTPMNGIVSYEEIGKKRKLEFEFILYSFVWYLSCFSSFPRSSSFAFFSGGLNLDLTLYDIYIVMNLWHCDKLLDRSGDSTLGVLWSLTVNSWINTDTEANIAKTFHMQNN